MNIRVLDTYEVRRMDQSNWQVWQYKVLEGGKRKGEMDWVALNSFHGTVSAAVGWIAKHAPRNLYLAADVDLQGAIDCMREIERDMAKHAKAFEKAAVACR